MYGHDMISMLYGMMSYFAKLTDKDLSLYSTKTEFYRLGLEKA